VLFWDFDGVIKESVEVKTHAFTTLFARSSPAVTARIRDHHERNGGMSRFQKIPIYLRWAGYSVTAEIVDDFCARFSAAGREGVIGAAWVPGAYEYLTENWQRQQFVLVTGTPHAEITEILVEVGILEWFREVHGAPTPKAAAIASVLRRWGCHPSEALLIGDSAVDYEAARVTQVEFLLRKTPLNVDLQKKHSGRQCEDFRHG